MSDYERQGTAYDPHAVGHEKVGRDLKPMPNPTPEMLDNDLLFEAIWSAIKTWDVNVPASYGGYCSANGSHAAAVYISIKEALGAMSDLTTTGTTTADLPVLTVYADDSKLVLTITHDGKLVPGPGLSMDEATQAAAEMLVRHFEETITANKRPIANLMAAAEALADSVLFDDVGEMIGGKLIGGNGGLLSHDTITKADAVRRALDVLRK